MYNIPKCSVTLSNKCSVILAAFGLTTHQIVNNFYASIAEKSAETKPLKLSVSTAVNYYKSRSR